ncbi:class I SAM-dependent methyltransferase [Streptomyces sp. NPDC005761]|uniref:class I SAM-dependent methyltransferase n=1 Tax=Streptomyces sp. NPDC005761 TaxID=3157066 RepID=UPI00340B54FC
MEELADRSPRGARTIDVGAGAGISTRRLHDRGAHVVAAEPGPGLAAELHRALPHIPPARGDGSGLPFADLITYAQSWHWTDPGRSTPEARRVLRPGGALALRWYVSDHWVPWAAAQDTRLRRSLGVGTGVEDTSAHG